MLVDSHCHLDHRHFADARDEVLARARAAGIGRMISIGTRMPGFPELLALARAHDEVVCTVGIHPHEAAKEPLDDESVLLAHIDDPKVVGIGEAGLDYHYRFATPEEQARNFRTHIRACQASGLPLVVHTREADDDTARILAEEMAKAPFSGVIHCYSSSPRLADAAVEMGMYLGIGGILTFKRSEELRATVARMPQERLLLETDAPYLAPEPFRGKRNEPAYAAHTAACLARLLGMTMPEVASATGENAFRLFAKARPPAGAGT